METVSDLFLLLLLLLLGVVSALMNPLGLVIIGMFLVFVIPNNQPNQAIPEHPTHRLL